LQKGKITLPQSAMGKLTNIHSLIANPEYKWEMHIGQVISGDPNLHASGMLA
jgi:hypothetical protein